jgi:type III pantothenate kinase
MTLVFNAGNTNITAGIFDKDKLIFQLRIRTNINYTEDQYFSVIYTLLKKEGIEISGINGAIIGSVVPAVTHILEHMVKKYMKISPVMIGQGTKLNIKNKYKNKAEVGDDRIANAAAGAGYFKGQDLVIIDFGTAVSFDVVSKKKEYLGGAIMPGLNLSLYSLFSRTAKLPQVALKLPRKMIGDTTEKSIQSGILNGMVGAISHIIKGIKKELKSKKIKVILTGGDCDLIPIHELSEEQIYADKNLTLKGFNLIYKMNKK